MLITAHAKFFGASLYASTHHQPVPWLKNMQWAWDTRAGHSTHKYWDVFGQTEEKFVEVKCQKMKNGICNDTVHTLFAYDVHILHEQLKQTFYHLYL